MLDKELVVISELNNPSNSFVFYADFERLNYSIDVIHTNIDTIKANEVYTHIRNRNTKLEIQLIFIEANNKTIDDCIAFFDDITEVGETPFKAVTISYDGRLVLDKNFVIVKVGFEMMDFLYYENDIAAKARRANITLTLQVFQSNFVNQETELNSSELLFF